MARPGAAVRYLTRNIFTVEELSQSSTNGNPTRRLKRLDPNKVNAIRGELDLYFMNGLLCVVLPTIFNGKLQKPAQKVAKCR